jgi:hypothetical protein
VFRQCHLATHNDVDDRIDRRSGIRARARAFVGMRQALAFSLLAMFACDPTARLQPERPVIPETTSPKVVETPPAPAATTPPPRTPATLEAMLTRYDALVASRGDVSMLRQEIDRVAGQRDAHASRLFWYTDFEQAKAEAKSSGKPILSLRLLGRLDEELSCANSRLFRLVLYPNPQTSQFLRETYVLHWSTERPVPQLTLDFGDGRVVRRTITGNSVHYVLDAQGRIIDALPGLYGPAAFEKGLRQSLALAKKSADLSDEDSAKAVAKHHARAIWTSTASWKRHLKRVYGEAYGDYVDTAHLPEPVKFSWPSPLWNSLPAQVVNNLTMSKADMEAPSLSLMQPDVQVSGSWGDWSKIADGVTRERLDPKSRALIEEKSPRDWSTRDAHPLNAAQLERRFKQFERRITEEELRNEYVFHSAIHSHLSRASRVAFASTNDFIYTNVFMTPQADAWLGLMPTEAISGIPADGIVALPTTRFLPGD